MSYYDIQYTQSFQDWIIEERWASPHSRGDGWIIHSLGEMEETLSHVGCMPILLHLIGRGTLVPLRQIFLSRIYIGLQVY